MALIFVPVLGSVLRGRGEPEPGTLPSQEELDAEDERELGPVTERYRRVLASLIVYPGRVLAATIVLFAGMYVLYGQVGRGVEFFPEVEPEFLQVQVQTRGNLSIREADTLVRAVENRLLDVPEIETVYARTIGTLEARLGADLPEDVIGTIQLDLIDWRQREPAQSLMPRLRGLVGEIPGLAIQIRQQEQGPGMGQPVEVQVASRDRANIIPALDQIRGLMDELGGFIDVSDDRPLQGVEMRLVVDREEAARYGADVASLGMAAQLVTNGVLLGNYRPGFTDEEVDIRLRFPPEERTVSRLANMQVTTPRGLVPIANFVEFDAAPSTGLVTRVNGVPVHTISADAAPGELVAERIDALQEAIDAAEIDPAVDITFRGQAEDQEEAADFLVTAFVLAIFLMFMILVTQFNSLFQAMMVLTAVVFSTAGVLLGLLMRFEPFGIVMSGIGIVALAGIVVNNNIVLIDTYNAHRMRGMEAADAALLAGMQRLRPIFLTALTTIAGLMPMVLGLTVDFAGRDAYFGAPSTQYWIQLSTAIAGGLVVATPVTLLFTPAMLVWRDRRRGVEAREQIA
jgi:multidrug efflux pump